MVNLFSLYPEYRKNNKVQSPLVTFERRIDSKLQNDLDQLKDTFKKFEPNVVTYINDVDKLDLSVRKKNSKGLFTALSPISPIRRVSSFEDNVNDGNYLRAAGILALAASNFPEDCRDLKAAYKQIFKGQKPSYNVKQYQHPFSFFRGTLLEPLLKMKSNTGKKISNRLFALDKPLFETKSGRFINKITNVKIDRIKSIVMKNIYDDHMYTYKLKGSNLSRLIGRGMLRIPIISVYALSILELPSIIKAFNQKQENAQEKVKTVSKQIAKSCAYITTILGGIGIAGAYLARKGPTGSLLGMGLGSVIGSYAYSKVENQIDNIYI